MSHWTDFNAGEDQDNFNLIPKNTLVKVRMTVKPGGYDDPEQGWTGGYATQSETTGAIYLSCEFVVLEGSYAKRRMWSLIGLHSEKGPEWGRMGHSFIKGILNSAHGLMPDDQSQEAQAKRRIQGLADLDGIEFVAKVGVEEDQYGEDRSVVKTAVTPKHRDYRDIMGGVTSSPVVSSSSTSYSSTVPPGAKTPAASSRPSWAQ